MRTNYSTVHTCPSDASAAVYEPGRCDNPTGAATPSCTAATAASTDAPAGSDRTAAGAASGRVVQLVVVVAVIVVVDDGDGARASGRLGSSDQRVRLRGQPRTPVHQGRS